MSSDPADHSEVELTVRTDGNDGPGSSPGATPTHLGDGRLHHQRPLEDSTVAMQHGLLAEWTRAAPLPSDAGKSLTFSNFYKPEFRAITSNELLSGLTVGLAQVPEAVAFAFVAGVDPLVGLHAAWILGLVTAVLGGRPGMISGATGGTAVVMVDLVADHGVEYLFYAVILMGIWEFLFAFFRLAKLGRMISAPVMVGFANGLAIIIGLAQLGSFKIPADDDDSGARRRRLLSNSFDVFTDDATWITGTDAWLMAMLTVLTMVVMAVMPKLTKNIPAALAGIVVTTMVEHLVIRNIDGNSTRTVEDIAEVSGGFPIPVWLDDDLTMPPINWDTFTTVLPTSVYLAIIGILQSLMTKTLFDEITQTSTMTANREVYSQSLGNVLCGVFGAMGGCPMIGQSLINAKSRGWHRLSSATAAISLLLIILVASPLINIVPVSALAGVMFVVVLGTFEWHSLRILWASVQPQKMRHHGSNQAFRKIRRADAVVIVVVTVVTVFTNLAIAVGCGIMVNVLTYAWDNSGKVQMFIRVVERPRAGLESRRTSITETELQQDIADAVPLGEVAEKLVTAADGDKPVDGSSVTPVDAAAAAATAAAAAATAEDATSGEESKTAPEATAKDGAAEDGAAATAGTGAGAGAGAGSEPTAFDIHVAGDADPSAVVRVKIYEPRGDIFFGSVRQFLPYFDVANDPENVEIHLKRSAVLDFSAMDAINTLANRYQRAGKQIRLRHLSESCHKQFSKASKLLGALELDEPNKEHYD